MTRIASAAGALLLAALACLVAIPQAQADGHRFHLTVSRTELYSGQLFTATGTANTRCTWIIEWNGTRQHGVGRTLAATFKAPRVTKRTKIAVHGQCFYNPVSAHRARPARVTSGAAEVIRVTVPPSWNHSVTITVLPPGSGVSPPTGPGGGLPNTGGPNLWLFVGGVLSLVAGVTAVRYSRKP